MVKLLRLILGYITIKVSGDSLAGFINGCYRNNIRLYDNFVKKDVLLAKVSIEDYKRIHSFRKKCGVRVKIVKKRGLPFLLSPYKNRYGIFVGIPLYFLIIAFLALFIWNIEIKGNKTVSDSEVLATCKKIGVSEGVAYWKLDTNALRLEFLIQNPKFSWASFIIEGSHITVNVSETKQKTLHDTSPANLVAKCDGTIKKVMVKKGVSTVKVGETVFRGELLASGTMPYTDGSTNIVNATGEVIAQTRHEVKITVPNVLVQKKYINAYDNRKILSFFTLDIPLSLKPIFYPAKKNCDVQKITYNGAYAPVFIKNIVYDKEYTVKKKLTKKEQIAIAKQKFSNYEKVHPDIKFLDFTDECKTVENAIVFVRNYKCEENIAIQEKIKISVPK